MKYLEFAVYSEDMEGVSIEHWDADHLKAYCGPGRVIARREKKRSGFSLKIDFHRKGLGFHYHRLSQMTVLIIGHFTISYNAEYRMKPVEVVYKHKSHV